MKRILSTIICVYMKQTMAVNSAGSKSNYISESDFKRMRDIAQIEAMNNNPNMNYVAPKSNTKKNSRAHNMSALQQEVMVYICLVALFGGILLAISCLMLVYCLKE